MELYGINEAAKYLGLSRHTIRYHLYKSKLLKGRRISDAVVFTQDELDAFKAKGIKPGPKTKNE